jgi:hypothetical protein
MEDRMKEYLSLSGKKAAGTEKNVLFHNWLPYGVWLCDGGREVLFNRYYEPIWERTDGVTTKSADHKEWVHWTATKYFFNDGNPPWVNRDSMAYCLARLREFGATWEPIAHYAPVKHAAKRLIV